jgi:hypothetical protein
MAIHGNDLTKKSLLLMMLVVQVHYCTGESKKDYASVPFRVDVIQVLIPILVPSYMFKRLPLYKPLFERTAHACACLRHDLWLN